MLLKRRSIFPTDGIGKVSDGIVCDLLPWLCVAAVKDTNADWPASWRLISVTLLIRMMSLSNFNYAEEHFPSMTEPFRKRMSILYRVDSVIKL